MKLLPLNSASLAANVPPDAIKRWTSTFIIENQYDLFGTPVFDIHQLRAAKNTTELTPNDSGTYRILSSDVDKKYTCIDLFAGCGGVALGLENAGFNHILVTEIDKHPVQTLRHNRPEWNIICDDITNINFIPYYDTIDVVEGGFPCQAFSYAGKRLGLADPRGTLFNEYARAIEEIMPRIFIAENVPGLITHDQGRTLHTIIKRLSDITDKQKRHYAIQYKILHSQFYDVPQTRSRIIILGLRSDITTPLHFPAEKNYTISIRKALRGVPSSAGEQYPKWKKPILDLVPEGGSWKNLPEHIQKQYLKRYVGNVAVSTSVAKRLSWDLPSPTLLCRPSQKLTDRCHPEHTRPLTIREYARIQTFPDTWEFQGPISSQYKQIGNAVPVNLAYHIGTEVYKTLHTHDRHTVNNTTRVIS